MRLSPLTTALFLLAGLAFTDRCCAQANGPARPKLNFDESKVGPYILPDPLRATDGAVISSVSDWESKRRPELLQLFAANEYGVTPAGIPPGTHARVTSVDPHALGGKAVRKEITIWFNQAEDGPAIHLLTYQPTATGPHRPWPVFLGLNYTGNEAVVADPGVTLPTAWMRDSATLHIVGNRVTEATRGTASSQWQVEELLARGYATATAYYGDICPDNPAALSRGIGQFFHAPAPRTPEEWGAIGEWAWGLSRAMDYLASDPDFDSARVAVHGHSRLGKAALWAGAQDQRFAIVISNESGCAGAKIGRRNFGQTPTDISISFPYWFCEAFARFRSNEAALPIDQHELLALVAPRGLYVAAAQGDVSSDSRGQFLGLKGAESVYALYGKAPLPASVPPAVNTPVASQTLGFHERTGPHAITPYDWEQYLAFADRYYGR